VTVYKLFQVRLLHWLVKSKKLCLLHHQVVMQVMVSRRAGLVWKLVLRLVSALELHPVHYLVVFRHYGQLY